MTRLILLVFAIVAVAPAASAQPVYPYTDPFFAPLPPGGPYRGPYRNPYYAGPYPGGPAAVCQKLCIQDTSPCDPPEFKRADGRCTDPMRF